MRIVMVLVCFLLVVGFVHAQESTITTTFGVSGCETPSGSIAAGACSRDGAWYCGVDGIAIDTVNEANGCAFGASTYSGGTQCCPFGYVCDDDDDMTCVQRTTNCGDNLDESSCVADSCSWIGGVCVDRPSDYSCSDYTSQVACEDDVWNLGPDGIGSGICGEYVNDSASREFVIPLSSCECVWVSATNTCRFAYDVSPDIKSFDPLVVVDEFSCEKDFTPGVCIDGVQEVGWTASIASQTGFYVGGLPPSNVLAHSPSLVDAALCVTGSDTRFCGQPVVKLSGFSLFALVSSVALIGLFYFFRRDVIRQNL